MADSSVKNNYSVLFRCQDSGAHPVSVYLRWWSGARSVSLYEMVIRTRTTTALSAETTCPMALRPPGHSHEPSLFRVWRPADLQPRAPIRPGYDDRGSLFQASGLSRAWVILTMVFGIHKTIETRFVRDMPRNQQGSLIHG